MDAKRVAVVGAGNGGCALAADLSRRGFQVSLYSHPQHSTRLEAIRENMGISFQGVLRGFVRVATLTTDLQEAVADQRYIIFALPSHAQLPIFQEYLKHAQAGQTLVSLNGNMSIFCFLKIIKEMIPFRAINMVETNALPFAAQTDKGGVVKYYGLKSSITLASAPSRLEPRVLKDLAAILSCGLRRSRDILELGLQANNGVIHPPTAILNLHRMQRGEDFLFYREGITNEVAAVIDEVDAERLSIAGRLGYKLPSLIEELNSFYGTAYSSIFDFATRASVYANIRVSSPGYTHRYFSEDIPYILSPWYRLGALLSYEAKTMKYIINLYHSISPQTAATPCRTLEEMGIAHMKGDEIIEYVQSI